MNSNEALIAGRILFIGAHPDDIEIGCGGTAARCVACGDIVAFAIATREKDSKIASKREGEAIRAAKLLKLSVEGGTLFFGNLPDTQLNRKHADIRQWLKQISSQFKPDTVFVHRKDDHSDHRAIFNVSNGVFQRHNVLLYYIPRPFPETPFKPNHAVDISGFIRQKVAMCRCHASQAIDYVSSDSVRTNSHYFYQRSYGRSNWRKDGYAEGFTVHSSRSPITIPSTDGESSFSDDLRLVKKPNGTFEWED